MNYTNEKIVKKPRRFFPKDLDITDWGKVENVLKKLESQKIESTVELIEFMEKISELSSIMSEEMAWRYITMTRFADDEENQKKFNDFYQNIISRAKPYNFKFNQKFYNNPYRKELSEEEYGHLNRIISNEIELFREENIPLQSQEKELANKYGAAFSKLTVNYKGEEKTLSQLSPFLLEPDRSVREEVWLLRQNKMLEKRDEFNNLFDRMKELRIQQAKNAGFDNYRDYMHQVKGRFSYTPGDLIEFHDAVEKEVIPFLRERIENRRKKLDLDSVRPWDTSVDLDGIVLKPFRKIEEFIDKALLILSDLKPEFGIRLNKMKNSQFLDLDNRKGKAPGGYNYPLQETGAPFIFMNAVGIHRNIVTLLHESGHAMHTFATQNIKLDHYKDTPSEVAELASMAMEFLTMDKWNIYYDQSEHFKKAKRDQLLGAIEFLPWAMIVDAFQHWIYLNPDHSVEEREDYFVNLMNRFSTGVDWSGLERFKKIMWLFQIHIFEVPFYYIEYAMSQLGALAVYRNYRTLNKTKALSDYEKFLSLGYTKPVDQLYEAAGIKFDFSAGYVKELVNFVTNELEDIK